MYASRQQLTDLISEFQATGQMPEELVTILDRIITGVAGRYGFNSDLEDRKQEFYLLVLRKKDNIRAEGAVFNYLSTMAMNVLRARQKQRPVTVTDFEFVAERAMAEK